MSCRYIYNGVTYSSKEEFVEKIIRPDFLQGKSLVKNKELISQGTYDLGQLNHIVERDGRFFIQDGEGEYIDEFSSMQAAQQALRTVYQSNDSSFADKYEDLKVNNSQENFLQLLSRDNNWVTFFIKSIVQDSAKKGYEKVLFPGGDTASKIEGHGTLEGFKKEKEDRIERLETTLRLYNDPLSIATKELIEEPDFDNNGETQEVEAYVVTIDGSTYTAHSEDQFKQLFKGSIDSLSREISQLKTELERVEREGFGALRPIYNFYENTVKNILNKQYKGQAETITDEHGNQWFQVPITDESSAPTSLQKESVDAGKYDMGNYYISIPESLTDVYWDANKPEEVDEEQNWKDTHLELSSVGTEDQYREYQDNFNDETYPEGSPEDVSAFQEFLDNDSYLDSQDRADTLATIDKFEDQRNQLEADNPDLFQPVTSERIRELNSYTDTINNTHPDMVAQVVQDVEPSQAILNINSEASIPDNLRANLVNKDFRSNERARHTLSKVSDRLMKVFPEMRIEWLSPFDLNQEEHNIPIQDINSFIRGNTASLVEDRADEESTIDEILHPFTYGMYLKNRELFDNIYEAEKHNHKDTEAYYQSKVGTEEAKIEVVNRAIQSGLKDRTLLQRVVDFIRQVLRKIFPSSQELLKTQDISPKTSLGELSSLLLNGGYRFEHFYTQNPFYHTNQNQQKQDRLFSDLKGLAQRYGVTKVVTPTWNGYLKDGEEVARVSDLTKSKDSNFQGNQDSDDGTDIHAAIEDVMDRYVDKATGYKKQSPDSTKKLGNLSEPIYNKIETYVTDLLDTYSPQTRFLWENVGFNDDRGAVTTLRDGKNEYRKGLASTIDFIALTEDGKVHIRDWKTLTNNKVSEAVSSQYRQEWDTQLKEYRDTIKRATGASDRDFEIVRIVPFIRKYAGFGPLQRLTDVLTGTVDIQPASVKKLEQYVSQAEYAGELVSSFIGKMNLLVENHFKKNILEGDKRDYDFQKRVEDALNSFRLFGQLEKMYDIHNEVAKEAEDSLSRLRALTDIDESNTKKVATELWNISDIIASINGFRGAAKSVLGEDYSKTEGLSEEDTKFRQKLLSLDERIRTLEEDFRKTDTHLLSAIAHTVYGIQGLDTTEKKVSGFLNTNFTPLDAPEIRSTQTLSTAWNAAAPMKRLRIMGYQNDLFNHMHEVTKELKTEGKDIKDFYKALYEYDKDGKFQGRFKSRITDKFWQDRERVLTFSKEISDIDTFYEAYHEMAERKAYFKKNLEERLSDLDSITDFDGTLGEKKSYINKEKAKVKKRWDLENSRDAWKHIGSLELRETPGFSELYHADWYKTLLTQPARLSMYNYFMGINQKIADFNRLSGFNINKYTFIPNFEKGFSEDPNIKPGSWWKRFKAKLQVNENANLYGAQNAATGEREYRIFIPGVQDYFGGDYSRKSQDLTRNYAHILEGYENAMISTQLQPLAEGLKRVERSKDVYDTGKTNQILKNRTTDQKIVIHSDVNFNYLKSFIDNKVYGQKIQEGWDKLFIFTDKDGNKTTYSAMSILQNVQGAMYLKTFGANITTPLRMALEGLISSKVMGDRHSTPDDVRTLEPLMQKATSLSGKEDKTIALIGYMDPFLSGEYGKHQRDLSMSSLTKWTSIDKLTVFMEKSDRQTQLLVSNALLRNAIVVDGQLLNARQYVFSLPEYTNMYRELKDSPGELKLREKEYEKDVKQVVKNKGLISLSSVKDGKLTLPDIQNHDKAVSDFVNLVQFYTQKITGMSAEGNMFNYQNYSLARMFSTYKSWIPHLTGARYGKFKLNTKIGDFQWGRHLAQWDAVSKSWNESKLRTVRTFLGFDTKQHLINYAMKKCREVQDRANYENTLSTSMMDENEFIRYYLGNVESTIKEFRVISGILFSLTALGLLAGGGDDDDTVKNLKRTSSYQLYQLAQGFTFFYDPRSLGNILNKPIPALSFAEQLQRALLAFPSEWFYDATGQEDKTKKNNALKNAISVLPLSSEFLRIFPLLDADLAKEMGIRVAPTSFVR